MVEPYRAGDAAAGTNNILYSLMQTECWKSCCSLCFLLSASSVLPSVLKIIHLTERLLDEVTTVLDVRQQVGVGMIHNTDSFIDEQVRKCILHPEGHIQDVRHLKKKESGD